MIAYKTKLIPIHQCTYKHRYYENDGEITGVFNVKPKEDLDYRICYEIKYPDGFIDYVPVTDVQNGNYKIIGINEKTS